MPNRHQATRDAEQLLRRTWIPAGSEETPLPVDPVAIARDLGIDVYNAQLSPNSYGALVKRRGHDPTILLNAMDSPNRKRFSCAHELGHFVRREGADYDEYEYFDNRDMLSTTGSDAEEVYANNFAAALLMPEREVKRFFHPHRPVWDMALIFDVSQEAMQHRLVNLGLIKDG